MTKVLSLTFLKSLILIKKVKRDHNYNSYRIAVMKSFPHQSIHIQNFYNNKAKLKIF